VGAVVERRHGREQIDRIGGAVGGRHVDDGLRCPVDHVRAHARRMVASHREGELRGQGCAGSKATNGLAGARIAREAEIRRRVEGARHHRALYRTRAVIPVEGLHGASQLELDAREIARVDREQRVERRILDARFAPVDRGRRFHQPGRRRDPWW